MDAYGNYLTTSERMAVIRDMRDDGWTQFHGMLAFTRSYVNSHETCECFASYRTGIAEHIIHHNTGIHTLYVNLAMFDCGRTTIKQFGRWLRENDLPCYQDIAAAAAHERATMADLNIADPTGECYVLDNGKIEICVMFDWVF